MTSPPASLIIENMQEAVRNSVHAARTAIGLTQEDLAGRVGVSRQTVIAIEKGNYVPSVLLALKIAKFFKRPVEDIFRIANT